MAHADLRSHAPPKYTCPRCRAKSCSLACSQRHKSRTPCSAVRDPGSYLKPRELATPAAFDRDFNFLTTVERGIERAERDASARGVELNEPGERTRRDLEKGEANLTRGLQAAAVMVERAPKGMSRRKENQTAWHKG